MAVNSILYDMLKAMMDDSNRGKTETISYRPGVVLSNW